MNLIDLLSRKDSSFVVPDGVVASRRSWGGDTWRAVALPPGAAARLRRFVDTHPLWTRPDHVGWYAATRGGAGTLAVSFTQGDQVLSSARCPLGPEPAPVRLPWPLPGFPLDAETELRLEASGDGPIDVLVHRMLSRDHLYALAKGRGVEVGPGPRPQILPSPRTEVLYVEEMPPERWAELNNAREGWDVAAADWSNVHVGKASDLPVDDASLDFIFSSHLFEHLSNPLGHLERWARKLRPGGVVLAVVPDMASTKDRAMRPSTLDEIRGEHERGEFDPLLRHYERFLRRITGVADPDRARLMHERGESIHCHYYDRDAIAAVLDEAVARLGYREFQLLFTQNHKDFHFALCRGGDA